MSGARSARIGWSTAVLLALLGAPGRAEPAEAPPTVAELPSDTEQAREAFRQGSALAKQGRWADALSAFRQSARLRPHPITTYDVAYCERALGRYARASLDFATALSAPTTPGAPELPPDLAARARTLLEDAERRVARLRIRLSPPDVTVRVDGFALVPGPPSEGGDPTFVVAETEATGDAPLPPELHLWLDPGTHVFVVKRSDGGQTVDSRTVVSGSTGEMTLPTPPSVTPAPAPAPKAPEARSTPAAPVDHEPGKIDRSGPIVAFAIGAAGLVGGGVFGVLALDAKHTLDDDPRCQGKQCPDEPHYRDLEARAGRFSDFATIGLCVGAAGMAVGTVLWVTAKPSRRASVTPWVGVGSAGLSGRF